MPKFKKNKSKFKMKGWSPFTSSEFDDDEKIKYFEELLNKRREEEEQEKDRLKIHNPKGQAY